MLHRTTNTYSKKGRCLFSTDRRKHFFSTVYQIRDKTNLFFFFFSYVVGIPGISMLAYGITGAGQLGRDTALSFSRRERRTSYRLGWSGKIFSNG